MGGPNKKAGEVQQKSRELTSGRPLIWRWGIHEHLSLVTTNDFSLSFKQTSPEPFVQKL